MTAYTATLRGVTVGRGTRFPWREMPTGFDTTARTAVVPYHHGGERPVGASVPETTMLTFDVHLNGRTPAEVTTLRDTLAAAWAANGEYGMEELAVEFADGVRRVYRGRPASAVFALDMLGKGSLGAALLTFAAYDPLWYSGEVKSVMAYPPVMGGGVTVENDGVLVEDDGVIVEATPSTGDRTVVNEGTAPAHWQARLVGPLTVPRLYLGGVGVQIDAIIPAGATGVVDSRTESVTFDGAPRPWIAFASTWWRIPPGQHTFSLRAEAGTGSVELTWRDANY